MIDVKSSQLLLSAHGCCMHRVRCDQYPHLGLLVPLILCLHIDVVTTGQDLRLWDVISRSSARRHGHDLAILVDELEVVAAQEVGDGRELGSVSGGVVVKLEERDCKEFHVLGYTEDLCFVGVVILANQSNGYKISLREEEAEQEQNILDFGS